MKRTFTFIFSLFVISTAKAAQNPILNPSFETWPGSVPTNWVDAQGGGTITQVAGYAGSNAVRGAVVVSASTYTPTFTSQAGGFVDSLKFTCLRFWYKLNLAAGGGGNDKMFINVDVRDAGGNSAGYGIGNTITANATNWTLKQISLLYTGIPAKINLTFTVQPTGTDPYAHNGTWFIIDSVSLGCGVVGIDEIEESNALQIYPNPVHSYFNINTPSSKPMQIKLSDALGRVVVNRMSRTPISGYIQDTIQVESLSSGLYLLMMTSEKKTIFRRVIVD